MQVNLHIFNSYITALQVHDVELTSYLRICDVITSHRHHVAAGCDQDRCVKSCPTLKMKSTMVSEVYF